MINSTAFSIPNFEEKGIENVQLYCESVENTTLLQHLFMTNGFGQTSWLRLRNANK